MEININRINVENKPNVALFYDYLFDLKNEIELSDSTVFFDFPIYKDYEGAPVSAEGIIISPYFGVCIVGIPESVDDIAPTFSNLENAVSHIHSRIVRNKYLRKGPLQTSVPINYLLFVNSEDSTINYNDNPLVKTKNELNSYLKSIKIEPPLTSKIFHETLSSLDGSKGLIRPKQRDNITDTKSKGYFVKLLEEELCLFDHRQRYGYVVPADGPQRIRGIAGSGKTVVLAMRAAITHLKIPDAKIVYTFYTKSLYQHVKRLITRFYRQFDDKDPDWDMVKIMHGWGGHSYPGVYYEACRYHGVPHLTYSSRQAEAYRRKTTVFDVVCSELKENTHLAPIYDYIFIDEGQDFPASFIDLCRQIAINGRVVWAYDELQNIFNIKTPTQEDVFGKNENGTPKAEILEDTVLYKSYRNPREIITVGHALGFGICNQAVQMFEDKGHWLDTGYAIIQGQCVPGELTIVERPEESGPSSISNNYSFNEIVHCAVFSNLEDELTFIIDSIKQDLTEGLRADDILVSIVDDRNAKIYAKTIESMLLNNGILTNNTHSDNYGIVDFFRENSVTISTVHKAKGNEAYKVYVCGVDSIFSNPDIINRNKIFTAITRAKAWVTITGVGENAEICRSEIQHVAKTFPRVEFIYPHQKDIKVMRRDMSKKAQKKQSAQRKIDEILKTMTPDEIREYIQKI